jgi:hypothetical protein
VVDLKRVDGIRGFEDIDGEEVAVDRLEHGERDVAESLGVAAPVDPRTRGDAEQTVTVRPEAGASTDR